MSLSAVLRTNDAGQIVPRRKAATFPELASALRHYLAIITNLRAPRKPGLRYRCSEELVLFNAKPVWANLRDMTLPAMQVKECFDNAAMIAGANPEYRYTEGFALMDGSIPTHHGWLTGPSGEAADPTWPAMYERHAEREPSKRWSGRVVYMGISVDREAHLRWMERTGYPNFLAVRDDDVVDLLKNGLGALIWASIR